jgi:hypothetical protein
MRFLLVFLTVCNFGCSSYKFADTHRTLIITLNKIDSTYQAVYTAGMNIIRDSGTYYFEKDTLILMGYNNREFCKDYYNNPTFCEYGYIGNKFLFKRRRIKSLKNDEVLKRYYIRRLRPPILM